MYRWLNNAQYCLFPQFCLLCGVRCRGAQQICKDCYRDLPWQQYACRRCGVKLQSGYGSLICGGCLKHPPQFQSVIALFEHGEPVRTLIHDLKFHHRLSVAKMMGEWLAARVQGLPMGDMPDLVVPVPLHPSRLRERGYNQALEIARPICKRTGLRLAAKSCERTRATAEQSHLNAKQRKSNIRGAFSVQENLYGKRVAIVDDVMTTGNTVNELAGSLRKAGAEEVLVWVCARAS